MVDQHRSMAVAALLLAMSFSGCAQRPSAPPDGGAAARAQERAALVPRTPDAFYDPPASVPNRPGALLRSEPLKDVKLPTGVQGWRILYTTTVDDRTPATAMATIFAPATMPPGPRPVITWVHGTTGLLQKCMPSVFPAPTLGIPAVDRAIGAGWVIVATDYGFVEKGGPHPYIIGEGEARSGLDAMRAARQVPGLQLDTRTVVWGHSQGGHSALWTGMIGPRYAPEIQIVGVAAIAPAANMKRILETNPSVNKRLGPYVASAYSRFYPDVRFEQAIRPEALAASREIVNRCGFLEDAQRIAALTAGYEGPSLSTDPAVWIRLAQNGASAPIAAPVLIAQGLADPVVTPAVTDAYVAERCSAGQRLEYWTFAGRDHGSIVQPGTPLDEPLAAWTAARFAGEPAPSGCPRKSF